MVREQRDSAEHTVFHYKRWDTEMVSLERKLTETINLENLIGQMTRSRENWENIHGYAMNIMKDKEKKEKRRESNSQLTHELEAYQN